MLPGRRAARAHLLLPFLALVAIVAMRPHANAAPPAHGRNPRIIVAVAANAVPLMERVGRRFEERTSATVVLSSGATGMLARQAREGAPFDLFVSADMITVEQLAADGVVTSGSVVPYARGRLMMWQIDESRPRVRGIADLASSAAARLRIAIANPEIAPYGAAARQALEKSGVSLSSLRGRIAMGENVGQALRFAETGNADVAFVPASLLAAKGVRGIEVPESLHEPIVQGMAILSHSKARDATAQLHAFMLSEEAQAIARELGYRPPRVAAVDVGP